MHTSDEGYEFSTLGKETKLPNNNTVRGKHTLATKEIIKTESRNKTKNVQEFLCAQTTCINLLVTYNEVNLVTQHTVERIIFTQVGTKKGIRLWGERDVAAIMKEMKQFYDRNVAKPLKPEDITPDIRQKALGYLMFLKQRKRIH